MRMDWVPVSAALLVTGVMALAVGSMMTPDGGGDAATTFRLVEEHSGRWLAVSVTYFLASVAITLGLPALLTLFDRRGRRMGMLGIGALAVGLLGTAGFAAIMVFFRALIVADAVRTENLDVTVGEAGLVVFLAVWVVGFYLGELLLAIALLRAGFAPRWAPILLLVHVATLPVNNLLPDSVSRLFVLILALGFAGIAIKAAAPHRSRLAAV